MDAKHTVDAISEMWDDGKKKTHLKGHTGSSLV